MDFPQDLPGNSHAARKNQNNTTPADPGTTSSETEKPPVKKVVEGKVTVRPKSRAQRFRSMFLSESAGFGEHIVEKVVVPMVKDMMLSIVVQMGDAFRQGVEGVLFGPDSQGRRRSTVTSYGTGRPVTNYQTISTRPSTRRSDERAGIGSIRVSNRVQQVILPSREEGDWVLEQLDAAIDDPDVAHCTLADYYSLVKVRPQSTDHEWGWTDLSQARVNRVSEDEFVISFPRLRPIENG